MLGISSAYATFDNLKKYEALIQESKKENGESSGNVEQKL
jgi:hypothetical protein